MPAINHAPVRVDACIFSTLSPYFSTPLCTTSLSTIVHPSETQPGWPHLRHSALLVRRAHLVRRLTVFLLLALAMGRPCVRVSKHWHLPGQLPQTSRVSIFVNKSLEIPYAGRCVNGPTIDDNSALFGHPTEN